jgi:CrcB protein
MSKLKFYNENLMTPFLIFSVSIGAVLGALLRWGLGILLNPLFPTLPLGTLAANLIGGFLMGIFMGLTQDHPTIPQAWRLTIVTGFLGSLTTFSTFSAETVTLFSNQEYLWTGLIIAGHVIGSLGATIFGIYTIRYLLF